MKINTEKTGETKTGRQSQAFWYDRETKKNCIFRSLTQKIMLLTDKTGSQQTLIYRRPIIIHVKKQKKPVNKPNLN